VLEFLQKRALNIIFLGSEYTTNLIIANVETLNHNGGYSSSFSSSDGHEFGGHGPLASENATGCSVLCQKKIGINSVNFIDVA